MNEMISIDQQHSTKFTHMNLEEIDSMDKIGDGSFDVVFVDEADYAL
jgi:type I site-specific restriction endonuclease